mgnify:CR=1 FL=1
MAMKQLTKKKELFDRSLLKIVVCPASQKPLQWDSKKNELISKASSLAYPVISGIPILIKEKARKL